MQNLQKKKNEDLLKHVLKFSLHHKNIKVIIVRMSVRIINTFKKDRKDKMIRDYILQSGGQVRRGKGQKRLKINVIKQ